MGAGPGESGPGNPCRGPGDGQQYGYRASKRRGVVRTDAGQRRGPHVRGGAGAVVLGPTFWKSQKSASVANANDDRAPGVS